MEKLATMTVHTSLIQIASLHAHSGVHWGRWLSLNPALMLRFVLMRMQQHPMMELFVTSGMRQRVWRMLEPPTPCSLLKMSPVPIWMKHHIQLSCVVYGVKSRAWRATRFVRLLVPTLGIHKRPLSVSSGKNFKVCPMQQLRRLSLPIHQHLMQWVQHQLHHMLWHASMKTIQQTPQDCVTSGVM